MYFEDGGVVVFRAFKIPSDKWVYTLTYIKSNVWTTFLLLGVYIELYLHVLFFAGDTMLSTTFSLLGVSIETDDEEDESGLTSDTNDDATTQVLKIQ